MITINSSSLLHTIICFHGQLFFPILCSPCPTHCNLLLIDLSPPSVAVVGPEAGGDRAQSGVSQDTATEGGSGTAADTLSLSLNFNVICCQAVGVSVLLAAVCGLMCCVVLC